MPIHWRGRVSPVWRLRKLPQQSDRKRTVGSVQKWYLPPKSRTPARAKTAQKTRLTTITRTRRGRPFFNEAMILRRPLIREASRSGLSARTALMPWRSSLIPPCTSYFNTMPITVETATMASMQFQGSRKYAVFVLNIPSAIILSAASVRKNTMKNTSRASQPGYSISRLVYSMPKVIVERRTTPRTTHSTAGMNMKWRRKLRRRFACGAR
mmetsp:Transcript_24524/g.41116  ORF Transcript_24524/g.41116 Transcript_24524/m.41116 type:complete len:211 (-) Transcript_24524:232-864(-)